MKQLFANITTTLCVLACATPGFSQNGAEGKRPMFSYIANWEVARSNFKDVEKLLGSNDGLMKKMIAEGAIVGFGNDITLLHQPGETTHDVWWSSMSWAGMLKTLEAIKATDTASAPAFGSGKHEDHIYVSRYYNWKPGTFTDGYTRVAVWKLKSTAPENSVEQVSKNFVVPMFEKLLADGAIYEYEVDEEAVHSKDPGQFLIVYVAKGPEGLDKAAAALAAAMKSSPFAAPTLGSWVDESAHRDGLYKTTGTYK